ATSGRFCWMFSRWVSKARSVQPATIVLVIVGTTMIGTIKERTARAPPTAISRRSRASTSSWRKDGGNNPTKVPQQPIMSPIVSLLVKKSTDDIHQRQPAQPMTPTSNQRWRKAGRWNQVVKNVDAAIVSEAGARSHPVVMRE